MWSLAVAALLVPELVTAAPSLPHNSTIVGEAVGSPNVFQPQNSCILVLFRGALHCVQDVNDGSDSAFPNGEQLRPYVDYRDCVLLKGEPHCEEPHSPTAVEEVMAVLDGEDINALMEAFDMTHPGYALKNAIEMLHDGGSKKQPGKDGVEDASANHGSMSTEVSTLLGSGKCCRKMCLFTLWWGPIAYGFCLASKQVLAVLSQ